MKIGIESDHGVWVQALVAAGYEVFAINALSVKNYRGRHSTSGAKSDAADAHLLAEIVRLDRASHRPVAADSDSGGGDQARGADTPDDDLGEVASRAAVAVGVGGVFPCCA